MLTVRLGRLDFPLHSKFRPLTSQGIVFSTSGKYIEILTTANSLTTPLTIASSFYEELSSLITNYQVN